MREEEIGFIFGVIFGPLLLLCGVLILVMAMWRRTKITEMAHKERMAMIERGQVPPVDVSNPLAWIAAQQEARSTSGSTTRSRMLSGGIVVIGFGLGLMTLIGVAAGVPSVAIGIGGAIVIVGLSLVAIALVQGGQTVPVPPQPPLPPPPVPRPTPQDRES